MGSRSGCFGWLRASVGGSGDHAAQASLVGFVGGGARRAAVEDRAHGNGQVPLGDVLVDGIVGEARERVRARIDFDFGLVGIGKPQDALGETRATRRRTAGAPQQRPATRTRVRTADAP